MTKPMPADKTAPSGIIVRQIPFAFDENIAPVWNAAKPEWSHIVNGASLTMPYLEPFLIRTVGEAMKELDEGGLKEDARGFMAQEGQHYQNHRRYNEMLKANGYPDLALIEAEMEADYKRLAGKPLKWRLAYTAGFETMTMGLTEWLITNRKTLFAGSDPSVTSLILWHMVEETEHKTVAFDLYQALYKDNRARAWGVFTGSLHVMKFARKVYIQMLKTDGRWSSLRSRFRLMRVLWAFMVNIVPMLLASLVPWYDPRKVKDPDWVGEWTEAYANLSDGFIPLLDTDDPEIPARFA